MNKIHRSIENNTIYRKVKDIQNLNIIINNNLQTVHSLNLGYNYPKFNYKHMNTHLIQCIHRYTVESFLPHCLCPSCFSCIYPSNLLSMLHNFQISDDSLRMSNLTWKASLWPLTQFLPLYLLYLKCIKTLKILTSWFWVNNRCTLSPYISLHYFIFS